MMEGPSSGAYLWIEVAHCLGCGTMTSAYYFIDGHAPACCDPFYQGLLSLESEWVRDEE